jgi:hypothetical protein
MARPNKKISKEIRQMVDLIVKRFHPEKVILFGSNCPRGC